MRIDGCNWATYVAMESTARRAKVPSTFSERDWENALGFWGYRCAYCGSNDDSLTQDHFLPLARGGGYTVSNIVPACIHCNSSKKDNSPLIWLVETFGNKKGCYIYSSIREYLKAQSPLRSWAVVMQDGCSRSRGGAGSNHNRQ